MDLRTGTLLGDYRVSARVGRGGMGTVYRARHDRIGRTVALKVLRDPALAPRFLNEARIQAGLRHPNVATLFDYFEADGHACIAMEFVEGETFADRLERGPVSAFEAARLFRPVVEAVAYLHDHGVIHRDLKSHNVKVTPAGRVALLDFGIAKDLDARGLTTGGAVPGTPEYLSPEQVRGKAPDTRSDVWALGILFYELLTGDVPFQAASTFSLFERITRADYAPPSTRVAGVPAWADDVVQQCLQPEPGHRFPNARAVLHALPALEGAPVPASISAPPSRADLSAKPTRSPSLDWISPTNAAWGFAGVAVLALVFAIATSLPSRPEQTGPSNGTIVLEDAPAERVAPPGSVASDVTIDALGESAEVWIDGRLVGETPYALASWIGESVEVELRRGGARVPVVFQTTAGKRAYTITLPSR
ncbi:serine/threonine-protein kinase [Rubrivirga sp.]|uniref:serine/threonine-protein kinase n=1 Tax=Rubrivirga sp. TaxID=1885344 RepID=UPI003C78CBEC